MAGGPGPLPSPRCSSLSHSLRFNSDPETPPLFACLSVYLSVSLSPCLPDRECPSSIAFLTKQIQTLKKKVCRFEDQFEQEMNYKPSHNDKYSNPEMIRVMGDLAKARRQLKGKGRSLESFSEEPSVLEHQTIEVHSLCFCSDETQAVGSLFRRLREKRQALGLPDNMKVVKQNSLVKPLYDRYQMIKRLLCTSPTIATIEEEDGSDEDSMSSLTVHEPPVPPPPRATRPVAGEEDSDRDSDPAFVSPMDEVKADRQQAAFTTANLHEASRSQLLECLRETRAEKKTRRKALREFEDEFHRQTGRICQKEDRSPMKDEYQDYKQLKAKLRLLEVLLSKQEVPTTVSSSELSM
uniref:FAM13A-like domain-containing protein n=1 Tax=Cyclopterus lumpus TaxID=8103 RepID=A0A8C2XIB7_CYCLU